MTLIIARIIVILIVLAISLGLAGCSQKVTISHSLASSISDNQSTTSGDNITNQSQNIPPKDEVNRIDVDKRTGKWLNTQSTINTLTSEQEAEIQKQIEQKRKLVDISKIRFQSGYSISTTPGTIEVSIQNSGKIPADNYYVIQLYSDLASVDKDTRDLLQQSGCVLYDYVPNYAFYAKISPEALDTVVSLVKSGKIRYLGRIPTEAKIEPELLAKMQANPDMLFKIVVQLFDNPDSSQMNSLGDIMQFNDRYYSIFDTVYGAIVGNRIQDILGLNFVEWVEGQSYSTLMNNDGTSEVAETQIQQPSSKWETFIFLLNQKIRELWHK